jgi:ATP-binding cassette subfamily B protein
MLLTHAQGCRRGFILAAGLSFFFLVFRLAQPWPLKWVIDGLSHKKSHWNGHLTSLSVAYIVVSGLAGLTDYAQRRVVAALGNLIVNRFRGTLFTHLLGLPLAYQARKGTGELLTRVVWDTARLRRGVSGVLLRMYQNTVLFLATVGVLVWISPLLAGFVLVCGLVAFGVMLVTNEKILSAARNSRKREGQLASVVEEDLRGARERQTFGQLTDHRFDTANERSLRGEQKLVALEAGLLFKVEFLIALSIALILWRGTKAVSAQILTVGDLVLFVHYTLSLYRPFTQFARQASQAGRTAACAERLLRIVERQTTITDGPTTAHSLAGEIAFEDVSVKASQRARGGRYWLLSQVTFRIAPGERVAVIGPNGAGKSTLFRHILRLEDPVSGRVLVDRRDVRAYTLASLRSQFSVLHQEAVLFGLTVRENVALGKPGAQTHEILEAIEKSGAGDFIRRLPKGLDTVVRGARIFSTGERQRLALARAILRSGRIWLLDEPTTALDRPQDLERNLLASEHGKTILWITHDLPTAMRLDKVLVLDEGRLRFFGSPTEFQAFLARDGGAELAKLSLHD